jgi:hypothetical protein
LHFYSKIIVAVKKNMDEKLKEQMNQVNKNQGFIKVTDAPVTGLTSEQKAILNRKGNVLFNQGEIDSARRLFITTGYSDGLSRVGDYYAQQNKELQALKLYWLAHNKRKSDPIIQKMATLISTLLNNEE